jgi:hypothetical protein
MTPDDSSDAFLRNVGLHTDYTAYIYLLIQYGGQSKLVALHSDEQYNLKQPS